MNRVPDERDMDLVVRSWMREEEGHPADRNRQVGRIMGRIDETHQRRGAWRFLPFGRGNRRSDEHDEELYPARRGVAPAAITVVAVVALVLTGTAFIALFPKQPAIGPGAPASSPLPTMHPEDVRLFDEMGGTWSGAATTLEDVRATYAEDAVHTALWLDRVERYKGHTELLDQIRRSGVVDSAAWTRLPDSELGDRRYLSVVEEAGGIACVGWIRDKRITRHDCILSMATTGPEPTGYEPPSVESLEMWDSLQADLRAGLRDADRDLIEQTVSAGIVHHVAGETSEYTYVGIDDYMSIAGAGAPAELAAPVPLPAPAGEHRWTDFSDVGGGTLCTFWERYGAIVRHDCIVPASIR